MTEVRTFIKTCLKYAPEPCSCNDWTLLVISLSGCWSLCFFEGCSCKAGSMVCLEIGSAVTDEVASDVRHEGSTSWGLSCFLLWSCFLETMEFNALWWLISLTQWGRLNVIHFVYGANNSKTIMNKHNPPKSLLPIYCFTYSRKKGGLFFLGNSVDVEESI